MRFFFGRSLFLFFLAHILSRTLTAACCKRSSSPSLAHTLSRTLVCLQRATNALEKLCEDFALYVYDFVITVYIYIYIYVTPYSVLRTLLRSNARVLPVVEREGSGAPILNQTIGMYKIHKEIKCCGTWRDQPMCLVLFLSLSRARSLSVCVCVCVSLSLAVYVLTPIPYLPLYARAVGAHTPKHS